MSSAHRLDTTAPNRTFVAIVLAGVAGTGYAFLIPLVLDVLRSDSVALDDMDDAPFRIGDVAIAHPALAAMFACCCALVLVARTLSQLLLSDAATDISGDLRAALYNQLLGAPITAVEAVGPSRLATVIAADVPRMVLGARMLPELVASGVTILGMLGFLLVRNDGVFWVVLGSLVIGGVTYQVPMALGRRYFDRSRAAQDRLAEGFAAMVSGAKELKLSLHGRSAHLADAVLSADRAMTTSEKAGNAATTLATNYGDLLSFVVIGFVVFVFANYHAMDDTDLIGVVMILLYIASPVAVVLRAMPQVAISRVSARRYRALLVELPQEKVDAKQRAVLPWCDIRLDQAVFAYPAAAGGFRVGPIDLTFPRGAITFVVGGNGSGKSTVGKMLALHYPPSAGRVLFGSQPIGPDCLASYRATIAAIHSTYHLFARPLRDLDVSAIAEIGRLLDAFELAHKVRLQDGRFSTLALSDGQRRRLALVASLVEDRDVYLFDEWAADQDPTFKAIFYHQVLPGLRAKGKAVVAITHDDRYFDVADIVAYMENGRVREVRGYGQSGMVWSERERAFPA